MGSHPALGSGCREAQRGLWACSRQINALEWSIPPHISELGEHLSHVQVNVCQSKQSFLAADKLPAQGERMGLVSSTQGGFVV